jgi:PIN domain nuclease of toxin-antitoxin system
MAPEVSVILDTCALLWLAAGGRKLSRAALKEINEAPAVYVSVISGFEISLKVGHGKLELSHPVEKWFGQVAEHHGLTILPLALDVCIAAAKLPAVHDDPFDRFIIATAKLHDLTVVTTDEQFEKYDVTVIC